MDTIVLLGGGRMGEALIGGLIDGGHEPAAITVVETEPARRDQLGRRFPGVEVVEAAVGAVEDASIVVVAVKPGDVATALGEIAAVLAPETVVVSIAAGVTTHTLEALLPGCPVVRAMPNTPALVRSAAAAIAPGTHADEAAMQLASEVLGAVGVVVRVPESQLDAVTGVSGSGPAYVFLMVEAMVDAAVGVGLDRVTAETLVHHTVLGAARMVEAGEASPEDLRTAVTSPGGTTAAGIERLEHADFRGAIASAVAAATERSAELGRTP